MPKTDKYIRKKKPGKQSCGAASSKSKKKKLERSVIHKRSRKSDTRYSHKSMIKQLNKLIRKRWGDAFDPTIGETIYNNVGETALESAQRKGHSRSLLW